MPNRDFIIKNLISFLVHGDYINRNLPPINLIIVRTDIKNYYPSINKHKLYRKISGSNVLSNKSLTILKKFLFNKKYQGVPLGLPFSNHLSELYSEDLDKKIKSKIKPLVYFRYIDDIIFIHYLVKPLTNKDFRKYKQKRLGELNNLFAEFGLLLNTDKTKIIRYQVSKDSNYKTSNIDFTFLGYRFCSKDGLLTVTISPVKIVKYKKRINSYFFKFRNSNRTEKDYWILYYQLLNELHLITIIDKDSKVMKSGLAYHYRYITSVSHLEGFMVFIQNQIVSLGLNSNKTHSLLNLVGKKINYEENNFIKKKLNYLKLTKYQRDKIAIRLKINPTSTNEKLIKAMFKTVYG